MLDDSSTSSSVERVALVGHDWGAALAWASPRSGPSASITWWRSRWATPRVPRRLRQLRDFWYMLLFQDPRAEELISQDDWSFFRRWMEGAEDFDRYLEDLSRPGA